MPTRAYVLIETEKGRPHEVVEQLRTLPEIRSVEVVIGPYDIVAVADTADLNAVGDLITGEIHAIDGIIRTTAFPSASEGPA